jgi:hypothetical protein
MNIISLKRLININPLFLLSLTIVLYILRMVGPYVNYVFIPVLFLYFLFTSIKIIKQFKFANLFEIAKSNFYLIIISAFFLWGFLMSSHFIFFAFKELLNVFIILFLSFSLFYFVKSKESFSFLTRMLLSQFIFFSLISSIFGLVKFHFQLHGIEFAFLDFSIPIDGTTLTSDYNFYTLFGFIGLISLLFGLRFYNNYKLFSQRIPCAIILLIISLNIFFSCSRRGFILLLFLILGVILFLIINALKRDNLYFILTTFLLSFMLISLLLTVFVYYLPIQAKRSVLKTTGISIRKYKYFTSSLIYRYSTVFVKTDYNHVFNTIWEEESDPLDPDTGWGSQVSTMVFPLSGDNVDIVPKNSIGYMMDKTCDGSTWNNNSYSYTDISRLFQGDSILKYNEYYWSSVYCYVSEDFDGTWAHISTEGGSGGRMIHEYDFNNKGVWQKLTLSFKSKKNTPPVYMYWSKYGVSDFSSLQGFIIFAHPEYKIMELDPKNPNSWGSRNNTLVFPLTGENVEIVPNGAIGYKMDSTSNASTWDNNAYSYTNISRLFKYDSITDVNESYISSVYCFVSEEFNGTWVNLSAEGDASGKIVQEYDLNKKGVWQKLQINFRNTVSLKTPPVYLSWSKFGVADFSSMHGYVIYAFPEYSGNALKN